MISKAIEDYLKAIYFLDDGMPVSTNEIARNINVSPSSVTKMIRKLAELNLVQHESHRGVILTESGKRMSIAVIRRHRIIELFLHKSLNYPWDEVHDEACRLEHCVTDSFTERLFHFLGNPQFDPYGDPIPSSDGTIPTIDAICLYDVKAESKVKVKYVHSREPRVLKYLDKLGILPNVNMKVIEVQPFGGSVDIQLSDRRIMVGKEAAENIYVTVLE